jgi:hypothetical protein
MEIIAEYQGKPNLDLYSNILNEAGRNMEAACWLLRIMESEFLFSKN